MMRYLILQDGRPVAKFKESGDRDLVLKMLVDKFPTLDLERDED